MSVVTGLTWMVAGNVLTRLLGLAGQILLGWFLLPEDFGVYAFSLGIVTAVGALRSGGITQVAVQDGQDFDRNLHAYFRYALGFNILAMTIVIGLALPYFLRGSATGVVLTGIALSIPAGTHASIARIRLTINGRFRELSMINFWSALVWQVTTVLLAMKGFGATSFALPSICQALYESIATWRVADIPPMDKQRPPRGYYWALFRKCRWVMLSAVMLALATTGDYFAVSLLTDAATVGTYFFAFQLVVAACLPINGALESILPTYLVSRGRQGHAQLDAYLAIARIVVMVGIPLCIGIALIAPLAIQLLWHGKWNTAIVPVQTLALCIPAWAITTAGRALMEAKAMWRSRFVMMAIYGTGGMSSAAIGSMVGDVTVIAVFVTVFYACFAIGLHTFLSISEVRITHVMQSIASPLLTNVMAFLVSIGAMVWFRNRVSPEMFQAILVVVFCITSGIANAFVFNREWRELFALIPKRFVPFRSQ